MTTMHCSGSAAMVDAGDETVRAEVGGTAVTGGAQTDAGRACLGARGLPEWDPGDGPGVETVDGLGNRKDEPLARQIHEQGVDGFEGISDLSELLDGANGEAAR